MWLDFMQSVENFIRRKLTCPGGKIPLETAFGFKLQFFPRSSSANPVNFGLGSLHNSVTQFFKIKAPHFPIDRQTDMHTHTHPIGSVSLENPNTHTVVISGEGNGNPLQCSCLENPMDGEAW